MMFINLHSLITKILLYSFIIYVEKKYKDREHLLLIPELFLIFSGIVRSSTNFSHSPRVSRMSNRLDINVSVYALLKF